MLSNNERVEMTRRYPDLPQKVLRRDAKIISKIIKAWDIEKNPAKVLAIYLKEKDKLSDERYWEVLRTVWILTGGVNNQHIFKKLMMSGRKEKHYFSTPEDAKRLREMPEEFEVFRAGEEGDNGISWTTSIEYAEYYLKAFEKKSIFSKTVRRSDVFAFIQRNLESEIIIL